MDKILAFWEGENQHGFQKDAKGYQIVVHYTRLDDFYFDGIELNATEVNCIYYTKTIDRNNKWSQSSCQYVTILGLL